MPCARKKCFMSLMPGTQPRNTANGLHTAWASLLMVLIWAPVRNTASCTAKLFFSGTQLLNSPTVQILRLRCPWSWRSNWAQIPTTYRVRLFYGHLYPHCSWGEVSLHVMDHRMKSRLPLTPFTLCFREYSLWAWWAKARYTRLWNGLSKDSV